MQKEVVMSKQNFEDRKRSMIQASGMLRRSLQLQDSASGPRKLTAHKETRSFHYLLNVAIPPAAPLLCVFVRGSVHRKSVSMMHKNIDSMYTKEDDSMYTKEGARRKCSDSSVAGPIRLT